MIMVTSENLAKSTRLTISVLFLVQSIRGMSHLVINVYSHVNTTNNLGPIKNQGNKSIVRGRDYFSIIDRPSNQVTVISFDPLQDRNCETSEEGCENSLLVVDIWNEDIIFSCGRKSSKVQCFFLNLQNYSKSSTPDQLVDYFSNIRPNNTNPTLTIQDDQETVLYAAACNQLNTECNLQRLTENPRSVFDSKNHFDEPSFLNIFYWKDKIYTFYRDYSTGFQYDGFIANGQRNEYGFVARVCTSDPGGVNRSLSNWITFVRARLLCPFPGGSSVGSSNTYYDVMTSSYKAGRMIYTLFSLPSSRGVTSSALCSYSLSVVDRYFDGLEFPGKTTLYYTPSRDSITNQFTHGKSFLPGQCPDKIPNAKPINDEYENFISETTLIASPIPPSTGSPSYASFSRLFKHIVAFVVGKYHVTCSFTDTGYMVKVRTDASDGLNPSKLLETQIPNLNEDIQAVSVVKENVLLVTKTQVVEISPKECSFYHSCFACEDDPHCDWMRTENGFICVNDQSNKISVGPLIERNVQQLSIVTGRTNRLGCNLGLSEGSGCLEGKVRFTPYPVYQNERWCDRSSGLLFRSELRDLTTPILYAGSIQRTMVLLSWKLVVDAFLYNITVREKENFVFAEFTVSPAERTTLELTGLSLLSSYNATVYAISADGTPSLSSSYAFKTGTLDNVPLVVVGTLLGSFVLALLIVLLSNNLNVGINTKEFKAGGVTVNRKFFFFWVRNRSFSKI